jgi:hypothetical protein
MEYAFSELVGLRWSFASPGHFENSFVPVLGRGRHIELHGKATTY